jgi:cell wall-associated NlpC family hydrolase
VGVVSGFAPAGLQAVQARVGQIEARLGALARTPAATGATGAAFARALDGARSTAGASADGIAITGGGAGTGGGAVTGDDVVQSVRKYLGVPYRWGGTDPATGLDCSGLVQRALADLGIQVPRVVADQQHAGTEVPSLAQARPGDLLVWRGSPNHIGVYLGDGKMIHAPRTGDVVKVSDVRSAPPSTIRRVVAAGDADQASAGTAGVPFGGVFRTAEQRYGLPAGVLAAVARAESGFDPDAVSGAGAVGLMQLMPGTAAELGVDPRDPVSAVDGAARYLRTQLDSFGDLRLALAAYNAGPGAVRRHGGVPPFDETRTYVARVLATMTGGGR